MAEVKTAPYGAWKSPVTTELITAGAVRLGAPAFDGEHIYWVELRPNEAGRQVIVHRSPDGKLEDVIPAPYNARTRVHEYGGNPFAVNAGKVYFSNYADQRLYVVEPGSTPQPLTPQADLRYAEYLIDAPRSRMICVREDHRTDGQVLNTLVSIDLTTGGEGEILASGDDFYASPALSPDGQRLAWLSWNHPNMPWDGTQLWLAALDAAGKPESPQMIAGGEAESIFQPQWSPDGRLYFISDRSNWWNPYRWNGDRAEPVLTLAAEFGQPQWVFGMSTYGFRSNNEMLCVYWRSGRARLANLPLSSGQQYDIELPYEEFYNLQVSGERALCLAASPTEQSALILLDLESGTPQVLRRSSEVSLEPGYLSIPEEIEFPTEGGRTAFGFFYPPRNQGYQAPPGERPPLLVMSHGGPTSISTPGLDLSIQYWASRGIAVLDVNYGGSTGYGREYRQRLNGQWGIVDVDDCINGARYLAETGRVDGQRLAITGGSAGGYTTLCALTFRDVFKAGASYYGIGDLETLAQDTHKFEARYLDRMVGPYPQALESYRQRSPIHFVERLNAPLILFQGLEDKVVPPQQSEQMYQAVKAKGLPVAYLTFEGEQHGFRKAETIRRALEAELYFYSRIFGFDLADPVEPVQIENL